MNTIQSEAMVPTVGMGATIYGYTDHKAATVIAVSKSGKQVTLQEDTATLLNGPTSGAPDALKFSPGGFFGHTSGIQRWETKPNPEGATRKFSLRDGGRWVEVGQSTRNGTTCTIGERRHHYDFNF